MKRRRFLALIALTVAAAGAAIVLRRPANLRRAAKTWLRPSLGLAPAPTGSLDPDTMGTLLATIDALLIETPVPRGECDRYAQYFQWHAENVPGYYALYQRFVARVNHVAGRALAEQNPRERRRTLDRVVASSSSPSGRDRLHVLVNRDPWLFRIYVSEEILRLYCRSDALITLGYESWPGTPRGLEVYRRAPHAPVRLA
jgi:hypothetical protein